jgi:GcrA cell cycle regulator
MKKPRDIDMKATQHLSETDKIMVQMWSEGFTGSEIGAKIGKTKNAVIGKINRLRKNGFIAYGDRLKAQKIKANIAEKQKARPVQIKVADPEKLPFDTAKAAPKPRQPVMFNGLRPDSCRYVINDGNAGNFIFCNKVKKVQSYCEEHAKICYVPARSKPSEHQSRAPKLIFKQRAR